MTRTLYLTTNASHASSLRRERLLREAGADLTVLAAPIDKSVDGYARRVGPMSAMVAKTATAPGADVIWAWGLDACFAASLGAAARGSVVVWDVSDLFRFQLRAPDDRRPNPFDLVERALIQRADHLILSSEGFYDARYAGLFPQDRTLFIENLLEPHPALDGPLHRHARSGPLKVVYAGILRSECFLDLIAEFMAAGLGDVEFHLHGVCSRAVRPGRLEALGEVPGVFVHGPYRDPDDLAAIYRDADVVFGLVDSETEPNERHLLPNRYYHAGYFDLPLVTTEGTYLGRVAAREGLGPVIPNTAPALAEALAQIRAAGPTRARTAEERGRYRFSDDYARALARVTSQGRRRHQGAE